MLDTSLPYMDIMMKGKMNIVSSYPLRVLPEGYTYRMYQDGDETEWAKLETSVGEFPCYEDAIAYFNRVFLPYKDILYERMCFIVNPQNEIVSTASAWFKEDNMQRYALLHWVSTSPKEQGKGLAKAILSYTLSKFKEVEERQEYIYLHTQTWSYKAIALYYSYGFKIAIEPCFGCQTDMKCIAILNQKLPNEMMADIVLEH